MSGYKHIEQCIGRYIGKKYNKTVEVGSGENFTAAIILKEMGRSVLCIDIKPISGPDEIDVAIDDVEKPNFHLYQEADCIYAIRPGIEMMPDLIRVATVVGADLLVYHLGCEIYADGGEIINCGVILRRYVRSQKEKRVD
ncbi:hypothetical protein RJ53_00675 [Methanocalculus chunghsingensis]|uniref:UPF0146 protein RJ53_00675 n=1 Tax=Methanocalculus chunghsingensis TaxID=156457 RepID=A0A8J7W4G5_9EURY|nr:UPF0146 family protein [Methanocalculus chunghsingensis]MBR1368084.1 hypothetical protein [Methanocalculus chunghsingensis]